MSVRLLVVAKDVPRPDHHAGDRRFLALLDMLARDRHVDFWNRSIASARDGTEETTRRLRERGISLLPAGRDSLLATLRSTEYDVVLFEFFLAAERNARDVAVRQPKAKLVVDSVDVHFARERAGTELGVIPAPRARETRKRELAAYRAADAVVVVTDTDEDVLRAERDLPPLFRIPLIMPSHRRSAEPRERELLFVAGFNHPPNADGLKWFVDAVWPLVRTAVPDCRLKIIGSNMPPEIAALDGGAGIHAMGFVADITPDLNRAAVAIAPLRYGSGMKGKVVEAMSYGVPVVTTSIGAQGLHLTSGVHAIVADQPTEFASGVTALLTDPERQRDMGLAGQAHIARVCSPECVEPRLDAMLTALVSRPRSVHESWRRWRALQAMRGFRMLCRARGWDYWGD